MTETSSVPAPRGSHPVTAPGPLTGIRVLDLSRVLAGPHCGRMLADMGADVIKVEPPVGDLTRFGYPRINSISSYFTQQNAGKRNISLDLKRPEAVDLLQRIADRCDVVLENFRPGVMERMGLGYSELSARNPTLVYASISGYGQTGPWVDRRAYAPAVGAEAGVTWIQGEARGGEYANDPLSHADVYTSLECLAGILAALVQRGRTGRGQWVEVSMAETMLCVNEHVHWELMDGVDPHVDIPSFRPADYPVLTLASGEVVVVSGHPAAKGNFESWCALMGRADLLQDPRMATVGDRLKHYDLIIEAARQWAATIDSADTIEAALAEHDFAMGVLRTVREIADSPWAEARGAIVEVDDRGGSTVRIPNSPWHFSDAVSGVRGGPAYRGEHNREVLAGVLGLTEAQIDALEAGGVMSSRVPGLP